MLIEVIICTHNRSSLLLRMLASLLEVERPDDMQLLITIVANACSDDTQARVRKLQSELSAPDSSIRYLEERTPGKSHALNLALQDAKGDWLCFIDDDHRIDKNYFSAIIDGIRNIPDASGFCGKILPDWDGNEPPWAHRADHYAIYPLPVPRFELGDEQQQISLQTRIPGGGNIVLRRDELAQVGHFKTELGPVGHNLVGAEDLDYVRRFIGLGNRLFYIPGMIQYHWVDLSRFTLSYLVSKAYFRSKDITLIRQQEANRVPRFLWKKLVGYLFKLLWPFPRDRARFYLVRVAATLGEIDGFRQRCRESTI